MLKEGGIRNEFSVKPLALYSADSVYRSGIPLYNLSEVQKMMRKMRGSLKKLLVPAVLLLAAGLPLSAQDSGQLNLVKPTIADRDLVIPITEVTENAAFYPVDIQGTRLEVIAVKAPDGTIRTAFNTCQVCYRSGRGFYKQQGSLLVCQNCGNRFRMSQIERRSGGCNPVPIFPANKTVTDTTITIPRSFLIQAKEIFANWKRS
jgi:hypothetical protein